jgi:four helix bundle protein
MAYQQAMDLVAAVYEASKAFPREEQFGLTSQIRRAAVSIPSNIAEGHGKNSTGEYLQALGHARGSLYEVETQLAIAVRIGLMTEAQHSTIQERVESLAKTMEGLIKAIREKKAGI